MSQLVFVLILIFLTQSFVPHQSWHHTPRNQPSPRVKSKLPSVSFFLASCRSMPSQREPSRSPYVHTCHYFFVNPPLTHGSFVEILQCQVITSPILFLCCPASISFSRLILPSVLLFVDLFKSYTSAVPPRVHTASYCNKLIVFYQHKETLGTTCTTISSFPLRVPTPWLTLESMALVGLPTFALHVLISRTPRLVQVAVPPDGVYFTKGRPPMFMAILNQGISPSAIT